MRRRAGRAGSALLLGFVLLVALWGVGFGQATACTNEYSCTTEVCPPACDWPRRTVMGVLVILPASGALAVAEALGLSATRPAIVRTSRTALVLVAVSFAGTAFLWRF
ncbi:MAG: hypothetical protein ACLFXM_03850 [Acidimicrobiia bacterium]